MAFLVPETKIETTFKDKISPLNLRKITLGTHFYHPKVVFWPFHLFCTFLSRFQSVKRTKTKSPILEMKMRSNQKIEENRPALKFDFT